MSTIKVDTITDETGTGAPNFPNGASGVATTAQGALADSAIQPGDSLAAGDLTGTLPALDGSALTSISAANLTGTLPAIDGSALTGVGASTTYGDVGTYTWGRPSNSTDYDVGDTASGLVVASIRSNHVPYWTGYQWENTLAVTSVSGTWRSMTGAKSQEGYSSAAAGLWVRIS